jgi:N-acyl homoserine lactone hydrolase
MTRRLRIQALPAGILRNFPVAAVQYQRGWGEFHDVPQIMFVITGGDHPIIVDSGTPDPEFVREHHGYDFHRTPDEDPLTTLRSVGVDPEDVRLVVNTHLHWDHCGNNHLFPNARFVVQKPELLYAVDPVAPTRTAFENTDRISPPWASVLNRFSTVVGDVEIAPGVEVIALPGHTPGSQGVLVTSGSDRFLLAGDTCDAQINWEGDDRLEHIPSGSFTNLIDYMDSFAKMDTLHAQVIPSHDPQVLKTAEYG